MQAKYYTLLKQQSLSPPTPKDLLRGDISRERLEEFLTALEPGKSPSVWHYDLETTGLDAHDPSQSSVVLGVSTSRGCGAVDLRGLTPGAKGLLYDWFMDHNRVWVAFNTVFDMSWTYRDLGLQFPRVGGCSLMLFRLLTSEGHYGQQYGLDTVQDTLLGWVGEGSATDQKDWLKLALKKHRLAKRDMCKLVDLEPDKFLWYCAIDAEASRQLWDYLLTVLDTNWASWGKRVWDYHCNYQLPQVKRVIRAQYRGVLLNREGLQEHRASLVSQIEETVHVLETDSPAAPIVQEHNRKLREEWEESRLRYKRVRAKKADEPWNNTDKWTKDEDPTGKLAAWEKLYGRWYRDTEYKIDKKEPEEFNWSSGPQLRWLLYENLYSTRTDVVYDWRGNPTKVGFVTLDDGSDYEMKLTNSGLFPAAKDTLGVLGTVGKLLVRLGALEKELGYLDAYIRASERDSILHVKLRPGATANGRTAGG